MKRSSLTPLAFGLAWMVSLGIVFGLGIISAFAFHVKPGAESTAGLSAQEQEAGAVYRQLVGAPLDWGRLRSFSPSDRVPPEVERMVTALAALPDGPQAGVLSARFFRILPPSKLVAALEHSLERIQTLGPQREAVLGGIVAVWAERDRGSARQFIDAFAQSGDPAVRAWASTVELSQ